MADSPIVAIRKFAARRGLQDLNPFLGKSSAWAAFMRGEIGPADFPEAVYEESKHNDYSDGISLGASGWADMLSAMAGTGAGLMGEGDGDGLGGYRPIMIQTLRSLRAAGWTVAALTNNFDTPPLPDPKAQVIADAQHQKFVALFDHFIESRVVGLMKPDPLFYEHALNIIGCRFEAPISCMIFAIVHILQCHLSSTKHRADEVIFLDDIGVNLKAAKAMGVHTILVENTSDTSFIEALEELQKLTGVNLLNAKL